jgi:hypothetical protein
VDRLDGRDLWRVWRGSGLCFDLIDGWLNRATRDDLMILLDETRVNVVMMTGMGLHHGEMVTKMGSDCEEIMGKSL